MSMNLKGRFEPHIIKPEPVPERTGTGPEWSIVGPGTKVTEYKCYIGEKQPHSFHQSGVRAAIFNHMADALNFLIINLLFREPNKDIKPVDIDDKEGLKPTPHKNDMSMTTDELYNNIINLLNKDRMIVLKEVKTLFETYHDKSEKEFALVKEELKRINDILSSTTEHEWQDKRFNDLEKEIKEIKAGANPKEVIQESLKPIKEKLDNIEKQIADIKLPAIDLSPIQNEIKEIEKEIKNLPNKEEIKPMFDNSNKSIEIKIDDIKNDIKNLDVSDKLKPQLDDIKKEIENIKLPELNIQPILDKIDNIKIPEAKEVDLKPVMDKIDGIVIPEPKEVDFKVIIDEFAKIEIPKDIEQRLPSIEKATNLYREPDGDLSELCQNTIDIKGNIEQTVLKLLNDINAKV